MGLLDPLTEYLQARGGVGGETASEMARLPWPCWDPTDRPRTWCFSTGPGCLYPRHSLGPCCGWWALTGKWVSWQPKILVDSMFVSIFLAFIKKVCVFFLWKESVAKFCWRPFGDCFCTLHCYKLWRRGICKGWFPTISNKICLLVALSQGCLQDRININCVAPKSVCRRTPFICWQLVVITTTLHCQGQDRLELFRGGRNDSVTLCLFEWGNRSKRATRQQK